MLDKLADILKNPWTHNGLTPLWKLIATIGSVIAFIGYKSSETWVKVVCFTFVGVLIGSYVFAYFYLLLKDKPGIHSDAYELENNKLKASSVNNGNTGVEGKTIPGITGEPPIMPAEPQLPHVPSQSQIVDETKTKPDG